jgi:hypothetical protein
MEVKWYEAVTEMFENEEKKINSKNSFKSEMSG